MTPLQDSIAMLHLGSGTRITKRPGHMMRYKQQQETQVQASGMLGLLSFPYFVQSKDEICN
ncbi:hypothetical protein Hanom_Chr12g01124621 [Helianthus anomalus]